MILFNIGEESSLYIGQKYLVKRNDNMVTLTDITDDYVTLNDNKGKLSSMSMIRVYSFKEMIKDGHYILMDKFEKGGKVGKSFLHLYKLTSSDGDYVVESYDGDYMSPKDAMGKMNISLRGLKAYKYKGVSSESKSYKDWYHKKDIGYSNTEAWKEVFEDSSQF